MRRTHIRRRVLCLILSLAFSLLCLSAQTQSISALDDDRPFEPGPFRRDLVTPPTRIMVLGISHLDGAPKEFSPEWLEPLLCRLRVYSPSLIVTEAMSGEQVMHLEDFAAVHGKAGMYAGPTLAWAKEAQEALHLSGPQAIKKSNEIAVDAPFQAAQRRHFIAVFFAAGDPYSALVQWLQLGKDERVGQDGLTEQMIAHLSRIDGKRSELSSIAARLAADLKRNRVFGAGDHSSDAVQGDWDAFQKLASTDSHQMALFRHETPELLPINGVSLRLSSADRVLPVLRVLNSYRFGNLDARAQYMSLLSNSTTGLQGRRIVDAWEAQNLAMTLMVREITALQPGAKALLVVGAAHKPFIEAYLRNLSDVEIVSSANMLDRQPASCSE